MHTGPGDCGDVGAIVDQDRSASSTRRRDNGFGNKQNVTSLKVALADLDHIDPRGQRAIREINQGGQIRACRLDFRQPAVGYQIHQRLRTILN